MNTSTMNGLLGYLARLGDFLCKKATPWEQRQSSLIRDAASEPSPAPCPHRAQGGPICQDVGVLGLLHTPQWAAQGATLLASHPRVLGEIQRGSGFSYSQSLREPDPGRSLGICLPTLCQRSLPKAPVPAFVQEASLSSHWESSRAQDSLLSASCDNHTPPRPNSIHNSGGDNDDRQLPLPRWLPRARHRPHTSSNSPRKWLLAHFPDEKN